MRILGIDPGLQKMGWGIIESQQNSLHFIACGVVKTQAALPLSARLATIDHELGKVIGVWQPDEAAIEETFVNKNPISALKLGQARGVAMVVPARAGLSVEEYAANLVKKSVVGAGHATKEQVAMMVRTLLPKSGKVTEDESDALAIAICHAHFAQYRAKVEGL